MPEDRTTTQQTTGREGTGREAAGQQGATRETAGRQSAGRESGAGQRKAEAGAERQPTYGVIPRSLDDLDEATGGHQLRVEKDALTWQHGITHIKNAHGPDLTERARELVRRALGELYQEAQGAEPASALAHEVADSVGDTQKLNELGNEQHECEHRQLKQRGQAYFG